MGNIKKSKKNYTPKFGKPKQMKHTDYHSSSSDDEAAEQKQTLVRNRKIAQRPAARKPEIASAELHENRLEDDSEHNFSDDEEEIDGDDVSDVEFDDEVDDDEQEAGPVSLKPASGSAGEDEDEEDAEDDDDDEESAEEGNADWAKSLAKILKEQKPKHKKIVALSKAKKTADIVEARELAKAQGFAIDGEIKEEKPDAEALDAELAATVAERRRRKRAAFELRIKPTLMDRDRERAFKKIATKGMVQLFNAVRTQQKDLTEKLREAGRLDHRRDAVLNNIDKRQFLDVLMGGQRAKSENVDNPVKDELKAEFDDDDDDEEMDDAVYNDGLPKNSIWSVLKEDFLSNKKMSHWDKDEEEDEAPNTDNDDDDDED